MLRIEDCDRFLLQSVVGAGRRAPTEEAAQPAVFRVVMIIRLPLGVMVSLIDPMAGLFLEDGESGPLARSANDRGVALKTVERAGNAEVFGVVIEADTDCPEDDSSCCQ